MTAPADLSCPLAALLAAHTPAAPAPALPAPQPNGEASRAVRGVEVVKDCPGLHQRLVYSYEEAAEQLSMSERFLRQLITDGELKAIGYGEGRRRRGVTHQALQAWVAERELEAGAPSFGGRHP